MSSHAVVSSSRTVRPCSPWGGRWIWHWRTTWSTVCSSGRRGGHTPFVQAGAEIHDTGADSVKPESSCSWEGHSVGWVPVSDMKILGLEGCPPTPHSIGDPPSGPHVCCCQMNWWVVVWGIQMGISISDVVHLHSMDTWALSGAGAQAPWNCVLETAPLCNVIKIGERCASTTEHCDKTVVLWHNTTVRHCDRTRTFACHMYKTQGRHIGCFGTKSVNWVLLKSTAPKFLFGYLGSFSFFWNFCLEKRCKWRVHLVPATMTREAGHHTLAQCANAHQWRAVVPYHNHAMFKTKHRSKITNRINIRPFIVKVQLPYDSNSSGLSECAGCARVCKMGDPFSIYAPWGMAAELL